MKYRTKIIIIAVGFVLTAIFLVVGLIMSMSNTIFKQDTFPAFSTEHIITSLTETTCTSILPTSSPECDASAGPPPNPTAQNETVVPSTVASNIPANQGDGAMASITIQTDRKTRTYDILPNVDEQTLKKNIGWLPSSALPNEEGLCVLMGHRDTDFSILKYAEIDDEFTVKMNGYEYSYVVTDIQIIDSDADLRFNAINGKNLVLVTCYPFRYTGHAPKKYVILCRGD